MPIRSQKFIGSSIFYFLLIVWLAACTPEIAAPSPIQVEKPQQTTAVSSRTTDVPAFPGAEGFGVKTPGGRFGRIILVTNLYDTTDRNNDNYAGSFRWAIEQTWPDDPSDPFDQRRMIIFKVGGVIDLADVLYLKYPYTTIAGQTAPGDGITLRRDQFTIATHDVIIRGMRFRVGDQGEPTCCRDGLNISTTYADSDVYNVVIDHSSISWAVDENVSTHADMEGSYRIHDVTIQWSIISEGLHNSIHIDEGASTPDPHSMGMLLGQSGYSMTIHHNLFANNWGRNPRVSGIVDLEIVNNLIYGWNNAAVEFSEDKSTVQIINNYFKANKDSRPAEINIHDPMDSESRIYVVGNISDDPRNNKHPADVRIKNAGLFEFSQLPLFTSTLSPTSPEIAYQDVLNNAGVIFPMRDAVDQRIVEQVKARTGTIIDSQEQVGGWPAYNSGQYPMDSDGDGIPNAWEMTHGLDPHNDSDANSVNHLAPDGFTWVEEYINSLIPMIH